ncbi:sensor histidine kinase [Alkalicoccobacillus plakortidis]|uniref:Histidine kinase n=1 Tax=Alkalicoccobacillus plakortidis TaxID=444060 RepID=A0ABT0XKP6_9BACI|nr:histidine kinase [Alkalicoccobacillus plakortidis]MCM2676305.1 histidine kinase [Alkalicoccobacillus plakortidis]
MMSRLTLFQKAVIILLLLLLPTVLIYSYSNYVTEQVIIEDIHSRNVNRLEVSVNQFESDLDQISQFIVALSIDSDISSLRNIELYSPFEAVALKENVSEKLRTYQQLSKLLVDVTIYMPSNDNAITTMPNFPDTPENLSSSWSYIESSTGREQDYFIRHVRYPLNNVVIGNEVIIEARVYAQSLRDHLDELVTTNDNEAFLFHDNFGTIAPERTNSTLTESIDHQLQGSSGTLNVHHNGIQYLVSYVQSEALDWVLIDFFPLDELLKPVYTSRYLLYTSVVLMIFFGVISGWLLYKEIHIPIRDLSHAVHKIKQADYSVRITAEHNNEFHKLTHGFNEMAQQIQTLIEQVYVEKIRSQDAFLKLMQAQINPHFLYNCLFYIKNMAKVQQTEAVEKMALHLGHYFRYRTRVEDEKTRLQEEIDLVEHFLSIHALRKKCLTYSISVPKDMYDLEIPRLLIQPIVENAIVHGIESVTGKSYIRISGKVNQNSYLITIEDNGLGLSDLEMNELAFNLEDGEVLKDSYGLRNVHQRLQKKYDDESGIYLSKSELGGLKVELKWQVLEANK